MPSYQGIPLRGISRSSSAMHENRGPNLLCGFSPSPRRRAPGPRPRAPPKPQLTKNFAQDVFFWSCRITVDSTTAPPLVRSCAEHCHWLTGLVQCVVYTYVTSRVSLHCIVLYCIVSLRGIRICISRARCLLHSSAMIGIIRIRIHLQ